MPFGKFRSRCATIADIGVVMIRDTIYEIAVAAFHHNMVIGEVYQTSSTRLESNYKTSNLAHAPRLANTQSTKARNPSTSAAPTPSATPIPPVNRSRSSPHTTKPSAPLILPPSRKTGRSDVNEDPPAYDRPPSYDQHNYTAAETENYAFPVSLPSTVPGSLPPSPRLQPNRSVVSFTGSSAASPSRIKVRDLNHIQSFASEEILTRSRGGSKHSLGLRQDAGQQYEISSMPVADIIEMVAGLLTKITTTNDRQHEHLHRHIPSPDGTTGLGQQATSVLAFHGKNVPSITILSYLSRIHKYCPTTYEVFLSLLVYFDRMTEMVNSGSLETHGNHQEQSNRPSSGASSGATTERSSSPGLVEPSNAENEEPPSINSALPSGADAYNLSHFFVVDSFNIHRLVIAGVTCASKFFSDVFYTNSRYAKVMNRKLIFT